MAAPARGLEGRQIGRYRLRFKIAEGGMAAVYLAQLAGARNFERWVAVKVIHPHHVADDDFTSMLLDEARIASRIHHPNVCSVLDFGEQDGLVHLVMEYLEGETLSSVIRRAWEGPRRFPAWLAARIVADAARGLHAAHELRDADERSCEIVHRDVSPQNLVVLYDGHTKVIDFGIARARSNISSTKVGEVKGKIAYLAPEQLASGAVIDRQADLWALGVVLWEASMGRRLFHAATPAETARNVVEANVPRPTAEHDDYPPELEAIVFSALARNRGARYADAKSLADDLEAFLYKGGKPAGAAQVAEYMKREFDDRLMVRRALLELDDGPEADALVTQDLHTAAFAEDEVGRVPGERPEESGKRRKEVPVQVSDIAPEDTAVDDLLEALAEPESSGGPLDSLGEPDMVVDLADLLEPRSVPPPMLARLAETKPRISIPSKPARVPRPIAIEGAIGSELSLSAPESPTPGPQEFHSSPPPIHRKSRSTWPWWVAAGALLALGLAFYLGVLPS